jgi:catechol 2,3-dioxygenase-like lactoylglutathione lyase family enzyme
MPVREKIQASARGKLLRMAPTIEKISAVTLGVANMTESVRFYRDVLGMELLYRGEDAAFSALGAQDALSAILNLEQGETKTRWGRLILYVADVNAFWAHLKKSGFDPECEPSGMCSSDIRSGTWTRPLSFTPRLKLTHASIGGSFRSNGGALRSGHVRPRIRSCRCVQRQVAPFLAMTPEQESRMQELTAQMCDEKDPETIKALARELGYLLSMKVDEMKSQPDNPRS